MEICDKGVNMFQIMNAEGDCRLCGWPRDCYIGNLIETDIKSIMHGDKAEAFQKPLIDGTYTNCDIDNCPYLANGKMEDILIDIDEIPDYPRELWLAYEGVCNYNCTCCTSYMHMKTTKENDYSENYERLEEHIREILPHVKTISANGRGELFASKRTLKLLQEWKPTAPKEEICVKLETNGSLFDETHWKQIENLGQYNLQVYITVMSFNEQIYQHLSGTKLPISRIEDNLRYVKQLRETGVINYLEIATVLQEENFREMPDFTRRCIEEFGADNVRIRPILPGGIYDNNIQWFMDVRNPEHPYYSQYVEVMKHPIFQHSKVLLWSGDKVSSRGKHPGEKSAAIQMLADKMLADKDFITKLVDKIGKKEVLLYGIGTVSKLLIQLVDKELEIKEIYDNYTTLKSYKGVSVKRLSMQEENSETVVVAIYNGFEEAQKTLRAYGFKGEIIDLYEV